MGVGNIAKQFLELNYTVNAESIIENISDAVFILRNDLIIHRQNSAAKKFVTEDEALFPSLIMNSKQFSERLIL